MKGLTITNENVKELFDTANKALSKNNEKTSMLVRKEHYQESKKLQKYPIIRDCGGGVIEIYVKAKQCSP